MYGNPTESIIIIKMSVGFRFHMLAVPHLKLQDLSCLCVGIIFIIA